MTKLLSGRVAKVPSANVSADRYEFIDLSETEPDLGLPTQSGWVLSSDVTGNRAWVDPVQAAGGIPFFANTSLVANVSFQANVANTVNRIDNFTTTNLREGSNLYYTDARVLANVSQMSVNVLADVDITGIVPNGILTWDGTKFIAGTITTGAVANTALFSYVANVANTVLTLNNFTTANLIESSSNLYYTNARARTAFTAGTGIVIDWAAGTITANSGGIVAGLTTADVREVSSNLYFTNARVVAALSNATITGNLTVTDTIFANTFTGANGGQPVIASIGSLTLSAGNNGNIVFTSNIIANKITANNLVINGNELFSGESGANLTVTQITANIWNGLYTSNVIETSGNLYFTNARVVSALIAGQNIIIEANGRISANIAATTAQSLNLTTADVREVAGNLYYTNARVIAALSNATITGNLTVTDTIFANTFTGANGGQPVIASIGTLTLSAGNNGNIVFTSNIIANKITANNLVINGNELFTGEQGSNLTVTQITANSWLGLYTANVIESSSYLYFTNARVASNVVALFTPNGNVSAYASKYIVEYNPSTKVISYSSTPDASNPYITGYSSEIHVSPVAFNDSGNGTIGDPVKTIAKAKQLLAAAFETTGAGFRRSIILHPGDYTENVTIDTQYTVLTTHELIGKNTTLSGTLTITKGCTIDGLKMTNLVISAASADGSVDIIGCTVTGTATKTSTAYTNFRGCDLSTSTLSITGAGTVVLNGGNYYTLTVNNASAAVLAKAVISMGPITLAAGTLQLSDTLVYSATNTANAITQSAGSVLTLNNSQTLIPDLTNVSRNSFGGYYSILSSVYDRTNSTFGGVSLNSVVYDQYINADRLILNGSTSGSTILNATGVAGSTTLTLPAATDTLVGKATTDTLTNKTLSNSVIVGTLTAGGGVGSTGQVLTSTVTGVQWTTTSTTADQANTVLTLSNFTTANLTEASSNQYFTNVRVLQAVNPLLTTANVVETTSNLYFTVARVNATVQPFLTTANVVETSGNLYFTNARARTAFTAGDPTIIIDWTAGTIKANVSAITANSLALTTADVREVASNLYFTVERVNATVQPFLTTANVVETSGNLYFTNARANAAIYPSLTAANIANFISTVNAIVQPFLTTANVVETSGNLYFTAARANATIYPSLTTANVIETNSNLYFTYARANATIWPSLTAANIANFVSTVNATVQPFLTTANVIETSGNLYYTNARARTAFTAGNGIIVDWANGTISSNISLTTANSLGLTTADVREVSSNLYFSNARAIASFGAGNGIEISQNGIISARGLVPLYTIQTAGVFGNISSTMSNIITFPTSTSTDRFMVRSIHVVNMSGGTALVSGNILYSTGNTVPFANQIPVSQGGILEFFKRSSSYQLFQPGDTINLQGFNAAGTATANLMCVSLAYDTLQNDETYIGTGKVLSNVDSTIQVYDSGQAYSVIESIKFVNLQSAYAPVKAWYADANGIPKAFFVYNLSIPPNSTVEILQSIKRIEQYDKIYASYSNAPNAAVSVFVSARVGSVTGLYTYTPTAVPGGAAEVVFTATDPEGTTFYYTIE